MSSTGDPGDVREALALQARAGDAAALDALLALIDGDGSVRIPVRQVVMDQQSVEDICQDVLIVVAERIAQWDGRAKFSTWLSRVARNKAIDHLRRTRSSEPLAEEEPSDQRRVSSLIATRVMITEVLEQLPAAYRDPVMLRDIHQHDYDEIAKLLDLPPATVRTRVSRGRAMVAARWVRAHQ